MNLVDNSVLKEKDKPQMALRPAVELSYLTLEEQATVRLFFCQKGGFI